MADPAGKSDRYYTYGDYRKWPDDERWELIDGVAFDMSPAPSRIHQGVVGYLFYTFYHAVQGKGCSVYDSPFDVLLPDTFEMNDDEVRTVVQPDVLVFCDESVLTDAGATGPPTLVVEVLSAHTASKDMRIKRDLYERHGVREYWYVDPGNRFTQVWLLDKKNRYPEEPTIYQYGLHATLSPSLHDHDLNKVVVDLRKAFDQ